MIYKFIIYPLILCLILLSNLETKELPQNTPLPAAQDYIIHPQNVLAINVYGEGDLSQVVQVSANGYISYPLLGKVKVTGLTIPEIEEKLTKLFSEYLIEPYVSVSIKGYSNFYVYGQVVRPGAYKLEGDVSLLEAITLAGGFTPIANAEAIKIIRIENGEKQLLRVKISEITKKGDKSKDILLKPNDLIVVPESIF